MSTQVTEKYAALRHAVSTDTTRYNINGVYFAPDGTEIAATDGHCLVVRKTDPEHINGLRGKIAELPKSWKSSNKLVGETYESDGKAQLTPSNSARIVDAQFPDYKQVIPRPGGRTIKVGISADLVAKVAKAMDVQKTCASGRPIYLHINPENLTAPIVVTCSDKDVTGYIMPLRQD